MSEAEKVVTQVLTERVLTISQARAELAEATGQRPDKATIHRWIKRGVGGVKLDAVRVGNVTLTSAEAINRFITARTSTL